MLRLFFIISISLIAGIASGQSLKELTGKSFVTKSLQYLAFLNDTTLYSSINEYNDTATFFEKNHTLYIKQQYGITDKGETKWVEKFYDYNTGFIYYAAVQNVVKRANKNLPLLLLQAMLSWFI